MTDPGRPGAVCMDQVLASVTTGAVCSSFMNLKNTKTPKHLGLRKEENAVIWKQYNMTSRGQLGQRGQFSAQI